MTKISSKELGRLRGILLDQIHDDPEMTPADQSVCYGIARRLMADMGGKARIGNDELVKLTHRDLRTVKRAIKNSVDRGHFKIESKCRGDRVFVPLLKEKVEGQKYTSKEESVEGQKYTSKDEVRGAEMPPGEGDICPSRGAEHPSETPAAEALLKSPSLYPSLYPSLEEAPGAPESPPSSTTELPTPIVHNVWVEGVNNLAALGIPNRDARKFIGKWLKETKDDRDAVLNATGIAFTKGTGDPVGLITKILQAQPRRGGYEQHVAAAVRRAKAQPLAGGLR